MQLHPVVRSVIEHLEAARTFDRAAVSAASPIDAFRLQVAAIYKLRAIVEVLREAAKHGTLRVDLATLDAMLAQWLPRLRLTKRLRIQDFHRESLNGPGHVRLEVTMHLPAYGRGDIQMTIDDRRPGLALPVSDGGTVKFFLVSGLLVQDELEPAPVPIPTLVREQCDQVGAQLGVIAMLPRRAA